MNECLLQSSSNDRILHCLDSSQAARKLRQLQWTENLKKICVEDAAKWRNQCASMLRRIKRIKDAMEKNEPQSLSPSFRENRMQSAIEDYSIQTGLDYEESKSMLVVGERGGTPAILKTSCFLQDFSPSDCASFEEDFKIAKSFFFEKVCVWILSRSLWLVTLSVFVGFSFNGSWLSAAPAIATTVVGLSTFPFPPHSLWKWLLAFSIFSLAIKFFFQLPFISDTGLGSVFSRLGLFKVRPDWLGFLSLIWTECFTIFALLIHLRSLYLSGRLALNLHQARQQIAGDARPTKDTYAVRFLLSLAISTFLITDWTRISASKIPVFSKSVLGEGLSRNSFSAWQVVAVTFFVLQIVLDRCLYTLMGHSPEAVASVRRIVRLSVLFQLLLLMWAMNLRVVLPFFLVYAAYLTLSCYQLNFDIRPVGGKSGFLWQPGCFSYYAYRFYLGVPFLDELRQICDWVATPATSLSLFMWFKVEDCIQNLRFVQAEMDSRSHLPLPRGERACVGVSAILGLILIITGPLVFFSGLNVLREQNPVVSAVPGLNPSGLKIWLLAANDVRMLLYASEELLAESVSSESLKSDEVLAPLLVMQSSDLQLLRFPSFSDTEFAPSPPLLQSLIDAVKASPQSNVTIKAEWNFNRELSGFPTILNTETSVYGKSVLDVLEERKSVLDVTNLIPAVVYLDSTPTAKIIEEEGTHKGTQLALTTDAKGKQWWSLKDPHAGLLCLGERSMGSSSGGSSSSYSISVIGLYLGVVLTVGRFLRLSMLGSSKRIDVEELPCTDTVMHLCQGIHIARLLKDVETEKHLYYDLVKLFRDPTLLIAVTGALTDL